MVDEKSILIKLNEEQLKACICEENFILTACPGSGKTRMITHRLAYLSTKHPDSRLKNIAITYTNRAAIEIEERVEGFEVTTDSIWTGTIHQFCMEYIIRPYAMYSEKLKRRFKIIDEFVKKEYVYNICDDLGITRQYKQPEDLINMNKAVSDRYYLLLNNNKEIDFNMILELSLELLQEHNFISKAISRQIRTIQVDEYQDTNIQQYNIIKEVYLQNKSIIISFIGDTNQAIYGSLGGVALDNKALSELYETNFVPLSLNNCYRSTQPIIDFYKNFQVDKEEVYSLSPLDPQKSKINYDITTRVEDLATDISNKIKLLISNGVKEKDICVLAPQRHLVMRLGKELRIKLPEQSFNSPILTPVKYDPLNPYYYITKLLFTEPGINSRHRRRSARKVLDYLNDEYGLDKEVHIEDFLWAINSIEFRENGIDMLRDCIRKIRNLLNISESDSKNDSSVQFFEQIAKRANENDLSLSTENFQKCFREKDGIVVSTYHGVKGEEYDTVIGTGILQGYIPNWSDIIGTNPKKSEDQAKYLLYVASSRAKRNLLLYSELGRFTLSRNAYKPTEIMSPFF